MPNLSELQNVWEINPYMFLLDLEGLSSFNSVSFQPLSHRDYLIYLLHYVPEQNALRRPKQSEVAAK